MGYIESMSQWMLGFLMVLEGWSSVAQAADDARAVMEKSEAARSVRELQARATLKIVRKGGSEKSKTFSFWRKLKADGLRFNTLTRFHAPAEVKDEAILFLENAEGANDVFLYLPAYRRVRRVERSNQSGSFMGSDLSYSDVSSQHTPDYDYRTLGRGPCPTPDSAQLSCHEIELKPRTESIRERTGYSQGTVWIREDNVLPVRAVYSDLMGNPFKEIESSEFKVVDPQGRKWFAHFIRVKNLKTQGITELRFGEVKANAGIKDSLFTQQALMSGAR